MTSYLYRLSDHEIALCLKSNQSEEWIRCVECLCGIYDKLLNVIFGMDCISKSTHVINSVLSAIRQYRIFTNADWLNI